MMPTMKASPPADFPSPDDDLPDGITRATIKKAVDRAMHPNKYAVLDNMPLVLLTVLAAAAFLLHKYIFGKKADARNSYVLGTAEDIKIKRDVGRSTQSHTIERPDNTPTIASSATKDAATKRNYKKLLADNVPEELLVENEASNPLVTEGGNLLADSNVRPTELEPLIENETPDPPTTEGGTTEHEPHIQDETQDLPEEVEGASYLNLDTFMSGSIDRHSASENNEGNHQDILASSNAEPAEHEPQIQDETQDPPQEVEGAGYLNMDTFMSGSIDRHSISETDDGNHQDFLASSNAGAAESEPLVEDKTPDPLQVDVASYLNLDTFMSGSIALQSHDEIELHSTAQHPGLEAYYRWKSTITSLYRIYAVPLYSYPHKPNGDNRTCEAVLPMKPSSERGNTSVYIEVTNLTSHDVAVYWVDYKGNEVYKGSMKKGQTWNQTTWIGHPWIFRKETSEGIKDESDESILLKYVPFRVIPSVQGAETVHERYGGNLTTGMQRFTLKNTPNDYGVVIDGQKWRPACVVDDYIMPEPPLVRLNSHADSSSSESQEKLKKEVYTEIYWSCYQMQREEAQSPGRGISAIKRLDQYVSNASMNPHKPKFRKLRISNQIFKDHVYMTGARGVLLALGFEEHYGYMECGAARGQMLTMERGKMFSDAMKILYEMKDEMESVHADMQPQGADGFGREGYGYAGSISMQ